MTGFDPATPRPPAVCANRTAPHPEKNKYNLSNMKKKLNIENLKAREIGPGFRGKFINGKSMTWAFWDIEKGASIPKHSHIHEQIMHVVSGKFNFTIDGNTSIFSKGDTIVIPSNCTHSGEALTCCKIMDVFSPKREEYK